MKLERVTTSLIGAPPPISISGTAHTPKPVPLHLSGLIQHLRQRPRGPLSSSVWPRFSRLGQPLALASPIPNPQVLQNPANITTSRHPEPNPGPMVPLRALQHLAPGVHLHMVEIRTSRISGLSHQNCLVPTGRTQKPSGFLFSAHLESFVLLSCSDIR